MNQMLSSLLGLLPVVGPVIAAAPEFKRHFDQVKAILSGEDQEVAKTAYDLAISEAAEAHADLQKLVAEHS